MSDDETLLFQKIDQIDKKLDDLKTGFPAWLDIRQASVYLQISRSTIRKLILSNSIPFRRVPNGKVGKLLFNRRVLDLWLLSGDVKPSKRARSTFEAFLD